MLATPAERALTDSVPTPSKSSDHQGLAISLQRRHDIEVLLQWVECRFLAHSVCLGNRLSTARTRAKSLRGTSGGSLSSQPCCHSRSSAPRCHKSAPASEKGPALSFSHTTAIVLSPSSPTPNHRMDDMFEDCLGYASSSCNLSLSELGTIVRAGNLVY